MRRSLCLIACFAVLAPGIARGSAISLTEALELAEEHDQRLEMTRVDGDTSAARALQEAARVLPSLEVGASVTQNPKEIATGGRVVTPLTQAQANLVGRLTLFHGPSVPGALAGWQEHQAARARALETAEELLRLAEARVRFDQGVPLEVEEAKAEVLRATADVALTRGTVQQVKALLALRLGMSPAQPIAAACDGCIPPVVDEVVDEEVFALPLPLPDRQDLMGQRLRVDAAGLRAMGSWLDFLPELGVVGTARLQEPTLFNPDPVWWTAQLVASWTLFEGGAGFGRMRERSSLARRAELEAALAAREADVGVQQARAALDAAGASDEAARARAEVAASALEQAKLRYREGLLSSLGVSEAARRKADADAQAVAGQFSVERATLRLRRALGLGALGKGEQRG